MSSLRPRILRIPVSSSQASQKVYKMMQGPAGIALRQIHAWSWGLNQCSPAFSKSTLLHRALKTGCWWMENVECGTFSSSAIMRKPEKAPFQVKKLLWLVRNQNISRCRSWGGFYLNWSIIFWCLSRFQEISPATTQSPLCHEHSWPPAGAAQQHSVAGCRGVDLSSVRLNSSWRFSQTASSTGEDYLKQHQRYRTRTLWLVHFHVLLLWRLWSY